MARLLPPESSGIDSVAQELGIAVTTLERWQAVKTRRFLLQTVELGRPGLNPCDFPFCSRRF